MECITLTMMAVVLSLIVSLTQWIGPLDLALERVWVTAIERIWTPGPPVAIPSLNDRMRSGP
jgi:hypothetical protein